MTQEEKARRYDEAIKRAQAKMEEAKVFDYDDEQTAHTIRLTTTDIFPELAESEDERIRKEMISWLKGFIGEEEGCGYTEDEIRERIAWLEKQGEQMPANKIEPKFKVGDVVTNKKSKDTVKIVQILHDSYCYSGWDGAATVHSDFSISEQDDWELIPQKPADKVEPRFKVGDWITNGIDTKKIIGIELKNEDYLFENGISDISLADNISHLWTIQDAKDGDVLATEPIEGYHSPFVAIYKKQNEEDFDSYCFIGFDGKFCKGENGHSTEGVHPATKEQRDTLFAEMKEAGYEWDTELKQLRKIEQKPAELLKGEDYGIDGLYAAMDILNKTLGQVEGYQSDDGILEHKCAISAVKQLYEQKPAWSEEDELHIKELESLVKRVLAIAEHENDKDTIHKMSDLSFFLKTLKPQLKQEWSEEDERLRNTCISHIEEELERIRNDKYGHSEIISDLKESCRERINWLKSLRPQNTWKPSDEQMKTLNEVLNFAANHESPHWNDYIFGTLNNLIRQLKKLKE